MKQLLLSIALPVIVVLLAGSQIFTQTILCVDRDGSSYGPDVYSDTWPMIMRSLDANGFEYDYIEVMTNDTSIGSNLLDAGLYDIMIWFTGETWTENQTMTPDEEFSLLLYQAFGGKLFLNSQDYLYDRYNSYGVFNDSEFPYSQLGVVEIVQDVMEIALGELDTARFIGSPGSLAEGLEFPVIDIFTEPTEDGLWIDSIAQHNGQALMGSLYPRVSTGPFAIQYETETFRTVFTTVDIASITDTIAREALMARVIDWLMNGTTGVGEKQVDRSQLVIRPNPVTDLVNFGTFRPMQEIMVFNNQGQLVHSVDINDTMAKLDLGYLPSGMYVVRVKTEEGYITDKLIKK